MKGGEAFLAGKRPAHWGRGKPGQERNLSSPYSTILGARRLTGLLGSVDPGLVLLEMSILTPIAPSSKSTIPVPHTHFIFFNVCHLGSFLLFGKVLSGLDGIQARGTLHIVSPPACCHCCNIDANHEVLSCSERPDAGLGSVDGPPPHGQPRREGRCC
jgi:hypothetical protein